jgi:hypothetical protein
MDKISHIFGIFFLVEFLFPSLTTPNVFIKKLFHVCFTLKIINCNEFHSDLISLFEKLDKNIEIGNNEWQRALFGEIETGPRNLKCKKFNFFQNQNDTCAHLFTLVMKFHDRQSSERCIRKLISRHCLDKTRTRWIIRFYLSLVRSVAYGESEVKLFACKEIINRW